MKNILKISSIILGVVLAGLSMATILGEPQLLKVREPATIKTKNHPKPIARKILSRHSSAYTLGILKEHGQTFRIVQKIASWPSQRMLKQKDGLFPLYEIIMRSAH